MAETRILVSYQELATVLVREKGIHEGFWGLYVRFGLNAMNANFEQPDKPARLLPAAVIPLIELGLQRFDQLNDLSVDASKVNPKRKGTKKPSSSKKK